MSTTRTTRRQSRTLELEQEPLPPTLTLKETRQQQQKQDSEKTERQAIRKSIRHKTTEQQATFQFGDEDALTGPPGGMATFRKAPEEGVKEKRLRQAKESEARARHHKTRALGRLDERKKNLEHTPGDLSIAEHADKKVHDLLHTQKKWELFKGAGKRILTTNLKKLLNWNVDTKSGYTGTIMSILSPKNPLFGLLSDTADAVMGGKKKLQLTEQDVAAVSLLAARAAETIQQFNDSGVKMCSINEVAKVFDLVLARLTKYQTDAEGKGEIAAGDDLRGKLSRDTILLMTAISIIDNEMQSIQFELTATNYIQNQYEREEAIEKIMNRHCALPESTTETASVPTERRRSSGRGRQILLS